MNMARLQDSRSICKNQLQFYISNKKSHDKIKKQTPFMRVLKRTKHLGIHLPKRVQNLRSVNYKMLLKI